MTVVAGRRRSASSVAGDGRSSRPRRGGDRGVELDRVPDIETEEAREHPAEQAPEAVADQQRDERDRHDGERPLGPRRSGSIPASGRAAPASRRAAALRCEARLV
jgi:hypothetical protein